MDRSVQGVGSERREHAQGTLACTHTHTRCTHPATNHPRTCKPNHHKAVHHPPSKNAMHHHPHAHTHHRLVMIKEGLAVRTAKW